MKCRETEYWLYSLRPNTSWPAEVATHLQGCPECRQLQARLRQVDQQVNQITSLPSNPAGKQQLLELIAEMPQEPASDPHVAENTWPIARIAAHLSAAAALLLTGWLLGQLTSGNAPNEIIRTVEVVREKPIEVIREKLVQVESPGERQLFASLLGHNARLVQSAKLNDRIDTMLDMADECRKHALKLIDIGPRDALPLTIDLYVQLLREGVVTQVQQAPEANRAALKEAARARLRKMADAVGVEKRPLPKVLEEHRDALEMAALTSLEEVDLPFDKSAARKKWTSGPVAPAAALVQFAIAFSAEADPVAKADTCSQCVQRLTPFMMLYLAEDSVPERGNLGQQFGEIIQFGVYRPLTAASVKEPTSAVKEQAERAIQATFEAVTQIEKQFEIAPDAAKPAIKNMLDASQKGKGKGPPWLRDPFSSPEKSAPKKGKSSNPGKTQKKASTEMSLPWNVVITANARIDAPRSGLSFRERRELTFQDS